MEECRAGDTAAASGICSRSSEWSRGRTGSPLCGLWGGRSGALSSLSVNTACHPHIRSPMPRRPLSVPAKGKEHRDAKAVGETKAPPLSISTTLASDLRSSIHCLDGLPAVKRDELQTENGPGVPPADCERLQRERDYYEKMYEQQKMLYQEVSVKHEEIYHELQGKIMDVVSLSTRNEENKRLIRQLRQEMADNRVRVVEMQNNALEERKKEKCVRERYDRLLHEQKEAHLSLIEEQRARLFSLERLLQDIEKVKGEGGELQLFHLDSLLKAAYAKNSVLFSDLLRQGRQIEALMEFKTSLEHRLEEAYRERRQMEESWAAERRHLLDEVERYGAQLREQHHSIIELRKVIAQMITYNGNKGVAERTREGITEARTCGAFDSSGNGGSGISVGPSPFIPEEESSQHASDASAY
ncbi:hypothetical protein ERJ75_001747700 [Trypanosoma vivax]|uniref:Uncharacterized protein n=1 Tax=Trypanosoma vivax (strain Y486) TaxID=1055687 RepID=G0U2M8_TRYVY|nr:hypothetical protein TRVL_02194 [Trypanosoma vivax]KAH8604298.1 hypothetical protein ERJ75_001747700 [Trypanosoma vivax]CCC50531.1 conserved hypothetical protein [Trypanosoma vivax Y486]